MAERIENNMKENRVDVCYRRKGWSFGIGSIRHTKENNSKAYDRIVARNKKKNEYKIGFGS